MMILNKLDQEVAVKVTIRPRLHAEQHAQASV